MEPQGQPFKYQTEIDKLIDKGIFLPNLFKPNNKLAYRYVFRNSHINNHKPAYIQKPRRFISEMDKKKATTSGYALSCFEEMSIAIQKFNDMKSIMRNICNSIGDSLCYGNLNTDDGLITKTNVNRHFDLYEFHQCDLEKKFKITQNL
ncbi:hypothetical protein EZS27_025471 [termite gut metagenome]|uniref:Uncharacterized protein n=1 Tax=termite gut metagenome TaxID=433724 RepID=A0A5J4QTZ7_9ZZZZ